MGIYQLIIPFYGLAWSISCSGLTSTVSKLAAKEYYRREYGNMGRLWKQTIILTVGISTVLMLIMFFGAGIIAGLIGDSRAKLPLMILSFSLPFMAAGSASRGYFLGLSQPVPPAISQVLEQTVRMFVVFALASFLVPMGLEYACAAAVIGIVAEEFVSCVYISDRYRRFKRKNRLIKKPTLTSKASLVMLVSAALPLTLNRVSTSLLGAFENVLIPMRLQAYGMTAQEALSALGRLTGMALPLIFFPSALLTSLAVTLVPTVAEAYDNGNTERITQTVGKAFLFTTVVGIGAAAIFLTLPHELGMVIYGHDISKELFLFAFLCPFWYLNIIMGGVLNGLGQEGFIFKINLLGSAVNICALWFLVPYYGLAAFIGGWFVSLALITVISIIKIRKTARIGFNAPNWLLKPALAAAATCLSVNYLTKAVFPFFGNTFGILVSLAAICIVYGFFIDILGCVDVRGIVLGKLKKHKSYST
jgi:stage V sporulation protein B